MIFGCYLPSWSRFRVSLKWEIGNFLHNWQNFRWNRVKMAKNGQKMAEINFGVSYIIIFFIFNFFCFSTFTFSYFLEQVFWVKFLKFCQNSGLLKYQMEKVEKQKKGKNEKIYHVWDPKINFSHFLAIFGHFYPISPNIFSIVQKIPNLPILGPPTSRSAW